MVTKKELHQAAISLREQIKTERFSHLGTSVTCGLCHNLANELNVDVKGIPDMVGHYAKTWPKFSGDYHFPVPSTDKNQDAADAYYYSTDNMYIGAYGKLRMELLQHIIRKTR